MLSRASLGHLFATRTLAEIRTLTATLRIAMRAIARRW
jgi:hypothetical protein